MASLVSISSVEWSNAANHLPDHSSQITIASAVCYSIACVSVFLRCFVRGYYVRAFAIDDWLMIWSLMLYTILIGLCFRMAQLGLGEHMYNQATTITVETFKYVYIGELFYNATTFSVKIAFGFFYLRILSEPYIFHQNSKARRWAKRFLIGLMVFTTFFAIIYGFVLIFQCTPISHTWTRYEGGKGHCFSAGLLEAGAYTHSAINASMDWILGLMPIPLLWKVSASWRTRITVLFMLSLATLASVSTIVRFVYVKRLSMLGASDDPTWEFQPLVLWSIIEPGVALFAFGIAASKPFWNAIGSRIRPSTENHHALVIRMDVEESESVSVREEKEDMKGARRRQHSVVDSV